MKLVTRRPPDDLESGAADSPRPALGLVIAAPIALALWAAIFEAIRLFG